MPSTCDRIEIGGRVYYSNEARTSFYVPFDELDDFTIKEIPPHFHLEVIGLPHPADAEEVEIYALNSGDPGETEELSIYGGLSYAAHRDQQGNLLRALRRAFPNQEPDGHRPKPEVSVDIFCGREITGVYFNQDFKNAPDTRIKDAIAPYVAGFEKMCRPLVQAFICHASEDKHLARELAIKMKDIGTGVWLDEWEIRVGDSIVEKINQALGTATHLIVLLSRNSVDKPWIKRELSSALMRQLSENSISVLPIRVDDCAIPPLLADIKHTTMDGGMDRAIADLESSINL